MTSGMSGGSDAPRQAPALGSSAKPAVPRSLRDSWRRLKPFVAGSYGAMAVLVVCSIVSGYAEAGILVLLVRIGVAISDSTSNASVTLGIFGTELSLSLPALFAIAACLAIIRLVMEIVNAWLPARLTSRVQARLRRDLFGSYIRTSWAVQSTEREGHLQELLTQEVSLASQSVQNLTTGLATLCNLAALLTTALIINLPAAVIVVVAGVLLFFAVRPLTMLTKRHAGANMRANVDLANSVSETSALAQEIRVFGADDQVTAVNEDKVDVLRTTLFRVLFLGGLVPAVYQSLALAALIGGLGVLYLVGSTQIVSLSATILILLRLLTYSQSLQVVYQKITGLSPYMERLGEVRERFEANAVHDGGRALGRVEVVAFRDAGFSYVPGQPVLTEVSVEVPHGRAVGIVGPSGAGKSTFVQLLLRLRDPGEGAFLINGEDAREFSLADWYDRIAFVPQDARVLSGTVADNIRFYRPHITDEQVERAARLAHIHDDIVSWKDGYDTRIGQRADAVSGGQRQRICLARALAHDPDIIVLDEPTSALDMKSEHEVQKSLLELKGKVSLFIVAHRLSTLNVCDEIMVFRHGRLDAFGSTEELTLSNDFFGEAVELSRVR